VRILSIQSSVAYGHVGNSAATFPLQRHGHEVWPVHTVVFSNHTGYPSWGGRILSPDDVREVIAGIADRGVLPTCDAVLSGYLGDPGICEVVIGAVALVKAANPHATYTCDPVMGNATSGCFVDPAIPPIIRKQVVPVADVITPNQFELGFLTGTSPDSLESTLDSADAARALGPTTVLVTSLQRPDRPGDTIDMLAVTGEGAWTVSTPRHPDKVNGSGDLTAALFTAHLRQTGSAADALAATASSVFAVLSATLESDESELRIVAAQDAIANPDCEFEVEQVR
jgi:pyridoxine kinase